MRKQDTIPTVEIYRGVGIHDFQDAERIAVVRSEIDSVHAIDGNDELLAFARGVHNAPEARLLAAAKLEAKFDLARSDHIQRPKVEVETVHAIVAGLNSQHWRSPFYFGSLLDPGEGQVLRTVPLADLGNVGQG